MGHSTEHSKAQKCFGSSWIQMLKLEYRTFILLEKDKTYKKQIFFCYKIWYIKEVRFLALMCYDPSY